MMSSKLVRRIVGSSVMARDEEHGACPARPRLLARLWRATACAHADRTFGWFGRAAFGRPPACPADRDRTHASVRRLSGRCPRTLGRERCQPVSPGMAVAVVAVVP